MSTKVEGRSYYYSRDDGSSDSTQRAAYILETVEQCGALSQIDAIERFSALLKQLGLSQHHTSTHHETYTQLRALGFPKVTTILSKEIHPTTM